MIIMRGYYRRHSPPIQAENTSSVRKIAVQTCVQILSLERRCKDIHRLMKIMQIHYNTHNNSTQNAKISHIPTHLI